MIKFLLKGSLTAVLTVSAIVGLATIVRAQSATGAIPNAESAQTPADTTTAPVVLAKLSVLGKGQQTTSAGACADAPCPSGDVCNACFSWTGLVLSGGLNGVSFSAPTLTGDFTLDNSKVTTSGEGVGLCFPAAGPSTIFTNAAKTGSIKLDLIGHICTSNPANPNLAFSGSYLVTGGTGVYSSAAGSGIVSADVNNSFATSRHTVQMNGTLLH